MLLKCKIILMGVYRVLILLLVLAINYTTVIAQSEGFYVRTTGKLPFLEYGTGDDRLGGAKMTILDTNILLKVIDSFKSDYKVRLSQNHTAYIDKRSVVSSAPSKVANHLTASWRVYGDSAFDYVVVGLDEKLPYRTVQQIHPSRVVVDIMGAASNTNWITLLSSVKEITNA